MARLLFSIILLALAGATEARERVTERQFLSALRADHPGLVALGDRAGTARAERARAGLLPNPIASYEREAPGNVEQVTWQLAWTPPLDGRRGAAVRAADAGVRAANAQLKFDQLVLRSGLRQAFAEWALTTERTRVVESHLELIRRLAGQMDARASRGEESRLAARRLALAALEVEAEAARSAAAASRSTEMALVWNSTIPTAAEPERPPLPAVNDSIQTTTRPDLAARRYEVEQAEAQLRFGKRFLQFPEVAFGWQRVRDDTFSDEGPRVAVNWPLPLFERQQPERIDANARLIAARARLQLAATRATAELTSTRAGYSGLRQAALAGIATAGEGDRALESATETFRLGESRLTDLLETLRSVLAARLAALDLYAAALEAHRALELAVGHPLSQED